MNNYINIPNGGDFSLLTTAYSSSTRKNPGSKFYEITEIQNILALTLTFVLAKSNPLILQLEQLSPSRPWNQMGHAISSDAEQAKLREVG